MFVGPSVSRTALRSQVKFASVVALIFLRSVSIFIISYVLSFLSYEYFNF